MGTRMRSSRPKVLHAFAGRSLLGHVLAAATPLEPARIAVVVGQGRAQVAEPTWPGSARAPPPSSRNPSSAPATRSRPRSRPRRRRRRRHRHGPARRHPAAHHRDAAAAARRPSGRGQRRRRCSPPGSTTPPATAGSCARPDGTVDRIVEQVDATAEEREVREASSGVFVFAAGPLRAALAEVGNDNAQGEHVPARHVADRSRRPAGGSEPSLTDAAEVPGVNDRAQLAGVHRAFNDRLTASFMRAGVRIVDPATTWLDVDVDLAPDSVVLPGTSPPRPAASASRRDGRTRRHPHRHPRRRGRRRHPLGVRRGRHRRAAPRSGPTPTCGPAPGWPPTPRSARSSR